MVIQRAIYELTLERRATFFVLYEGKFLHVGGGGCSGAGTRENRGRERYGRRERKGREAVVQRWRDAGVKCKTLLVAIFSMH